jgi:curved DNA-binding protein CbpA
MKKTFYAMAKAYHPDTSGTLEELSHEVREERFKKIVAAYEILKDDSKRRAYDSRMSFSTNYGPDHHNGAYYGFDPSQMQYTHFYAGRQRDYDSAKYRAQADAKFREDLREGTKKLFMLFCAAVGVIGVIETAALFRLSDRAKERSDVESYKLRLEVERARRNYDLGLMPDDRIARFLAARESTAYYYGDGSTLPAPSQVVSRS